MDRTGRILSSGLAVLAVTMLIGGMAALSFIGGDRTTYAVSQQLREISSLAMVVEEVRLIQSPNIELP